jgi:quinolinate synthase
MKKWSLDGLYEKLNGIKSDNPACCYSRERCSYLLPVVNRILELKAEKNAVILAHSYVHPDIIYTVADHVGDSYILAKKAMEADAETILFSAVRFMAETAKILNPNKIVLDPNPNGGCSLADSITVADVDKLRKQYPEHTFVCYINTTAAIKAACDICVTSSNVYKIIDNIPNDKIVFLPDKLMGMNVQKHSPNKEIVLYDGTCYVHEKFEATEIDAMREMHGDIIVLAHPECKPEVIAKADVIGSTSQMYDYVKKYNASGKKFLLLTECGIGARLQVEIPGVQLIGSCMLCHYMKSNSLSIIEHVLRDPQPENIVNVPENVKTGSLSTLKAMFHHANAS